MLIETPAHIRKARDAETGLELISIERSDAEGERAVDPSLPRGVGHIGVTVPDIDEATAFFRAGFGGKVAYDGLTRDDPPRRGREVERQHGLVNVVCSKGCGTGTAGCCAIRRRSSCGGCWSARRKG